MTAEEAMAAGLVTNVVSPDTLIPHCLEIASRFTAQNKQTMAFAKRAICRGEWHFRTRLFIAASGANMNSG